MTCPVIVRIKGAGMADRVVAIEVSIIPHVAPVSLQDKYVLEPTTLRCHSNVAGLKSQRERFSTPYVSGGHTHTSIESLRSEIV